jgi:hypothetical protein
MTDATTGYRCRRCGVVPCDENGLPKCDCPRNEMVRDPKTGATAVSLVDENGKKQPMRFLK